MKYSKDLKTMARSFLRNNYALPLGAELCVSALYTLLDFTFMPRYDNIGVAKLLMSYSIVIILSIMYTMFSVGLDYMHLNITRSKSYSISDIIYIFNHHPDRAIIVALVLGVISVISMLPSNIFLILISISGGYRIQYIVLFLAFFVFGILTRTILNLQFALSFYLLIDNPDMSALTSLRESAHLMNGYKLKKFYLDLSFIGYYILSALSFGLGFLWVMPYRRNTFACFYRDVKKELVKTTPQNDNVPLLCDTAPTTPNSKPVCQTPSGDTTGITVPVTGDSTNPEKVSLPKETEEKLEIINTEPTIVTATESDIADENIAATNNSANGTIEGEKSNEAALEDPPETQSVNEDWNFSDNKEI